MHEAVRLPHHRPLPCLRRPRRRPPPMGPPQHIGAGLHGLLRASHDGSCEPNWASHDLLMLLLAIRRPYRRYSRPSTRCHYVEKRVGITSKPQVRRSVSMKAC